MKRISRDFLFLKKINIIKFIQRDLIYRFGFHFKTDADGNSTNGTIDYFNLELRIIGDRPKSFRIQAMT